MSISTLERYVPIAPRRSALKGRMRRLVQVTVPGLFLSLAACGGNVDPNIQLNPHASMRYELTFTIDDPAVVLEQIEAQGNYQVANEACVPMVPVSGVKKAPIKTLPLEVTALDRSTYRVTVFSDALRDEDYFGMGVCHWSFVAATLRGQVSGKALSSAVFSDDVYSGRPSTRYYSRAWLTGPAGGLTESGSTSRETYRDPSNLFTIQAQAVEVSR